MNFLAHVYLSGKNDNIIIGNFIGDFVKGNQLDQFELEITRGIQLHREIDRFTDSHDVVLESKKRLWDQYHHYAAVIVDVFYDHFLARNWSDYHELPLKDFTRKTYHMLSENTGKLPERVVSMLRYMSQGDWLYHYGSVEGIRQALTGMAGRTTFESGLETAHEALRKHYEEFKKDFDRFFPELIQHSKVFLSSLEA